MKLKKIKLKNFRQFYDEQDIDISDDPEKNVTLIHAQNGVGKTTILNSVLWTFYNQPTKKFLEPEKIINFSSYKEGNRTASVDIEFSHDGNDYLAQRFHRQDRGYAEQVFKVHKIVNGDFQELRTPDPFVQSVMPQAMAPYFFFDGEHAETFSATHNHREVAKAIRNILGCNIAELAIEDLTSCAKKLAKDIADIPDASDLKQAEQELSRLETNAQQLDQKIEVLEERRSTFQETVDELSRQLASLQIVAAKQQTRATKEKSLADVRRRIADAHASIVSWAGRPDTLRLVAGKLSGSSLDFIDEETLKGRIPSPYNETFVKGLLQAHSCICGRHLPEGSDEFKAVAKLLESAGNALVLDRVVKARSKCVELRKDKASSVRYLRKLQEEIGMLRQGEQDLEQEIAAISKEIASIDASEVKEKEEARRRALNEIRAITEAIGAALHQKRNADSDLAEAKRRFQKLSGENTRARPLKVRQNLAEEAAEFLNNELKGHEKSARQVIQSDVSKIIKETARRDYKYKLCDDYRMELLYEDGSMVPRSTGESQLLSLAFIAALVRFAKVRSNANGRILIPGIVAPLILDSPFGQLDDVYREATARFVPKLAEQVVVLVSRSQGDENVLGAMRSKVGAEYVLTAENTVPRGGKREEVIAINGRTYPLTSYECAVDKTRVQQVK
ncbi:MAG: AAA family ATPase [Alphaproteobacteria bacterium]|nr:AAA family ATPase [Alphaproteobacteria bacterium]